MNIERITSSDAFASQLISISKLGLPRKRIFLVLHLNTANNCVSAQISWLNEFERTIEQITLLDAFARQLIYH